MNLLSAVQINLNLELKLDKPRYLLDGWFFQGDSPAKCPICETSYKIFRCPYTTSKGNYKYWAMVCDGCETVLTPDDISNEIKSVLKKWEKAET